MNASRIIITGFFISILITGNYLASDDEQKSQFTGELLPVFYVTDVKNSVHFYRDILGFEFHHFFDYDKGEQVKTWESDEPPIWALMSAGDQEFGLHLGKSDYELRVGGVVHYFEVTDVKSHYDMVKQNDIKMSELIEKPWMTMFWVLDPDGHKIFIQTPPPEEK
jgi:catechol 2,3-dioxygenase-like lactoylglutathione lyase family enzyme